MGKKYFNMKNRVFNRGLFLTIILVSCSIMTFAQNSHLKFKGIPIDGYAEKFVFALEKQGFTREKMSKGLDIMMGKFTDYQSIVLIMSSPKTETVHTVCVKFGEESSWDSLLFMYKKYKEMYSNKYGAPEYHIESFDYPFNDDSDGLEMVAVKNDKCNYVSRFTVDGGTIAVMITDDCSLTIYYIDKINNEKSQKESQSLNNEDI